MFISLIIYCLSLISMDQKLIKIIYKKSLKKKFLKLKKKTKKN